MKYYINHVTENKIEVLDLKANKKLEGTETNIYAAVSKALSHAYMHYGEKIVGGDIIPPEYPVHITYKEDWIDLKRIHYHYGCKLVLKKLTPSAQALTFKNEQLSIF